MGGINHQNMGGKWNRFICESIFQCIRIYPIHIPFIFPLVFPLILPLIFPTSYKSLLYHHYALVKPYRTIINHMYPVDIPLNIHISISYLRKHLPNNIFIDIHWYSDWYSHWYPTSSTHPKRQNPRRSGKKRPCTSTPASVPRRSSRGRSSDPSNRGDNLHHDLSDKRGIIDNYSDIFV